MRRSIVGLAVLVLVSAVLVAGGPAPAGAAPAVTVTPSTGLSDGQTVSVSWSGFSPPASMSITPCDGDVLELRCSTDSVLLTSSAGTADVVMRATFDTVGGTGPVDCRAPDSDCRVYVVNLAFVGGRPVLFETAYVPVTFVGPSTIGTIGASPDRGLDDGATSTVTLTGWPGVDRVVVSQCAPTTTTCTEAGAVEDPGDVATLDVTVRRVLGGGPAPVDCAYQACSLVATGFVGGEATGSASTPLVIGRLGGLEWGVDPATDVADGQVVRVRGNGAVIGDTYSVEQCTGFLDVACDTSNAVSFVVGSDGSFDVPVVVHARLSSGDDCTDLRVLCVIRLSAGDPPNGERDAQIVALRRVPIAAAPTTGLRDGDTLAVDGHLGANEAFQIRQCGPVSAVQSVCTVVGTGVADAGGIFALDVVVTDTVPGFPGPADCRVVVCFLQLLVDGSPRGTVDLAFAPRPVVEARIGIGVESLATAWVLVTASAPASEPITVTLTPTDGSARAGSDYLAGSRTVTIAPGATSAVATIPLVRNRAPEPVEWFWVRATTAAGATVTTRTAPVFVID